ncbi:chromate transporter [Spirochaeta isovalerica]|uniref:Chromate transporter n=1 Tax=Spirochaeta isovalerica TaxID=150 RepID=A0A841RBK3_9SPIO|nr:chromate transporter [Spirochaeta isovalerica]MBB6480058.1 chromate transporter [Spirochaeta isovalerica]
MIGEKIREIGFLYRLFFKIGLFSIGGGYVMLPMLKDELVTKRDWVDDQELLDYYAIGQATPGIIAINTSTFVGYKRQGIPGAIAATAGMVTPSLIIITLIAAFIPFMQQNEIFQRAFRGIRAAVAALLLHTLYTLAAKMITGDTKRNILTISLLVLAFTAVVVFGQSPVVIVLAAGLAGWIGGAVKREKV